MNAMEETKLLLKLCEPYFDRYMEIFNTEGREAAREYVGTLMPVAAQGVDMLVCDPPKKFAKIEFLHL